MGDPPREEITVTLSDIRGDKQQESAFQVYKGVPSVLHNAGNLTRYISANLHRNFFFLSFFFFFFFFLFILSLFYEVSTKL